MIEQRIRDFEIGDRIGSGGYGEVYRATQLSVDRTVAIKVILPQYAKDPVFVADFESEAKLVAQLEHTNIVPLHDYWQDEHGAFLVMRYVPGGSLKDMIEKQGGVSLARTVRLIEQIAEALAVAHDADVVHRDLKPANVLIDQRGNAYLTDFGIAKRLTSDGNSDRSGVIKGTFAYMSPEQINGEVISPQTDIYALGLMLYEMLAGKHPFHETPVAALLFKHMEEPLPDIQDIRDDLPSGINDVIQKATAKSPDNRYATASELVNDLKEVTASSVSSFSPQPAVTAKNKPTTTAERNRKAMLTNVRKFWVEGVLENSLHDAVMIDLGLKPESGAVDNPWDTLIRTPSGDETLNDERIIDVFDRMNGKLLILGDPGSGKTTTLLALARDLLNRAESDDAHPIPVVLNLSSWSEKRLPLMEWLVEELNAKYQVPRKVSPVWLANDELLLLLDGLDEVAADVRDDCVQAINTYRSEHSFVDVVVCSRIKDYEKLESQLRLNGAVVIQPLTEVQITQYLDTLQGNVSALHDFIKRDEQLRELAASPLMLSIMVLAYGGSNVGNIPDYDNLEKQRQHLFEVYVNRMLERRAAHTTYTANETRSYLHWLAQTMQSQARSVFHIEDMQPALLSTSQIPVFKMTLRLTHMLRMFLSLFVAGGLYGTLFQGDPLIYAVGLGLAGLANGWVLTGPPEQWRYPITHVPFGLLAGCTVAALLAEGGLSFGEIASATAFGVLNSLVSYLIGESNAQLENDRMSIVPKERLRFSRHQVKPQLGLVGFGAAVIYVVGYTPLVNPSATLMGYVLAIIFNGFVLGTLFLTYAALTSETIEQRVSPNEGMRRSIRNGISMALTIAPFFALTGIAAIPAITFFTGVITCIGAFFSGVYSVYWTYGGFVYEQHHLLRYLLQREGHIPHNLVGFLDDASASILMRKVGGGYIFIHRYLLEYFAALEPEKETA